MRAPIEFGFKTAPHHIEWATMAAVWELADGSGAYAQGWNFDHFYPIVGDPTGPCLESWVTLTALAERTRHIRIGTLVNGVPYRHPAVVAAMAASLDIISGGRLELGLGAGWNEQEANAYGIGLGSLTERFDRLDEALEIITRLLSEPVVSFQGRHFQLCDARNEPKGVQEPIPICIGGLGEKRTLRAVAKYAQHWNLPGFTTELYDKKRAVLAQHCDNLDRDIDEIKVSAHIEVNDQRTNTEVLHEIDQQAASGIHQAILYFQPPVSIATVERVTDMLLEY